MKNSFRINALIEKMKQLLLLESEQNFKLVLNWLEMLANSLSSEERVEAVKISDGLDTLQNFLKENHFLDDEMQMDYFQSKKKEILQIVDKVLNPDNYPAETLASKQMSFSERQIKLIFRSLETEFIPYTKFSAC
jgi:hypothetical protein